MKQYATFAYHCSAAGPKDPAYDRIATRAGSKGPAYAAGVPGLRPRVRLDTPFMARHAVCRSTLLNPTT